MYGGRFSVEVPADHESKIKLLNLDTKAKLRLLSPREFISKRAFHIIRREEERQGLGIGLVTNPVTDPRKQRQTISIDELQLIQLDFSTRAGSIYVVPLTRTKAFDEYNSKISVHFERPKRIITPLAAENFGNMETFNLIPTLDHVVNSNFSNATIRVEL